jgi:hypothetical protein
MIRITLGVLATLLAVAIGYCWFIWTALGTRTDGTRVSLMLPWGPVGSVARGDLPIIPAADLAAEGIKTAPAGAHSESGQAFFVRTEKYTLRVKVTAGDRPVESKRLGYVLLDAGGNALSRGELQPEVRIAPSQAETLLIVDPDLPQAVRVEVHPLP